MFQQLVMGGLWLSILLIVFGFGLQASMGDLLYLVHRPSLLARSLFSMFIVMPLLAVTLARAFDFPHVVDVALVALAISPVPPLLPRRQTQAGGRRSYALGLMVMVACLSVIIVPLAIYLLGLYLGRPLDVAPLAVARVVGTAAVLPLLAGMALHAAYPVLAIRITKPTALVANVLFGVTVLVIVLASLRPMLGLIGQGTIIALVTFVIVGLVVGHALGGPDPEERVVLALSTACRHPGVALTIAAANYPELRLRTVILLYLLIGILIGVPYNLLLRRFATKRAQAA
jgi:BASS family bile acid:Na+ symporter